MKKNLLICILLLSFSIIYAHELDIEIKNNQNNTMTISALFNTGESAAGVLLRLEDKKTKEILYEKRLPATNELLIDIPKIEYLIVFDEGDDDLTIKEGIAPKEGFIQNKKKKKSRGEGKGSTSLAVIVSICFAFLLLFATIFVSIRNTNKLIKELKK